MSVNNDCNTEQLEIIQMKDDKGEMYNLLVVDQITVDADNYCVVVDPEQCHEEQFAKEMVIPVIVLKQVEPGLYEVVSEDQASSILGMIRAMEEMGETEVEQ